MIESIIDSLKEYKSVIYEFVIAINYNASKLKFYEQVNCTYLHSVT